jgi:8-oxo-dGTP pyrophosphatase MutT (NUDIX family)
MSYQVIESKVVFKGRVFDVRTDQVLLPNNARARIDLVIHRDAVTLLPVDEAGNIWFIRQYRHPAGRELLELPAGVLEEAELPEAGAGRELREETGMAARKLSKIGKFYLAPGYSTEALYIFLAEQLYFSPLQADADEIIEVVKIPVAAAYQMAESGDIEDAKSLGALLLARPYLVESL